MRKLLITIVLSILLGMGIVAHAAFDPHVSPALTPHIGTIKIAIIRTVNPDQLPEGKTQAINYSVIVDDEYHNSMDIRSGDLIPHLTTAQKNQLIAFMDMLWTKAEDEIL